MSSKKISKKSEYDRIVAICQPNFLPWLGYFEMIDRADIFVALDDVQYVDREWVNRNRIRRSGAPGGQWITASVKQGPRERMIREVMLFDEHKWRVKMIKSLEHAYQRSPFFKQYFTEIASIITEESGTLVDLNLRLLRHLIRKLDIAGNLILSSTLKIEGRRDRKLSKICHCLGADLYLANNGSRNYIDVNEFIDNDISFVFQNYQHPVYPQGRQEFVPNLSVIDLLFWHGPKSRDILLRGRPSDWRSEVQVA